MPANGNNSEVRNPSPRRKATFFKRHAASTVFVVLFVLNVGSLIMIGQVNRLLQEGYIDLARAHEVWSVTNLRTAAMTKAAREANAPANDVFNSKRLDIEQERMEENLHDAFALIARERMEIGRLETQSVRTRLSGNLDQGEKQLQRMADASRKVFLNLRFGDKIKADSNMALADRRYGEFLDTLSERDSIVDSLQSDLFLKGEEYRSMLSHLVTFGILVGALMAAFLLIVGLRIAKEAYTASLAAESSATALRESESDLRRSNARLEHLLKAQQRFVANAAHQLRTPLAGIALQIELAQKSPPDEIQAILSRLLQTSKRAAHLSGQLLTLAGTDPESGAAPAMEVIDLRNLVRDAGLGWIAGADAKHIDFELVAGERPVPIRGNATLIGELLSNLVSNALRHAPEWGRVTILIHDDPQPELIVEDNGPGIPPGERDKVFERFYRSPGTVGEGSGLGLAIVRDIAHVHGAEVTLGEPDTGNGLRVCIKFPLKGTH
jgi:signal transduction histidine kinase